VPLAERERLHLKIGAHVLGKDMLNLTRDGTSEPFTCTSLTA
jgi:hypothetical protein